MYVNKVQFDQQAQSYGPDGCILMRVVETVPSNMPAPSPNVTLSPSTNLATLHSTQPLNSPQHDTKENISNTNTLTTITSGESQSELN